MTHGRVVEVRRHSHVEAHMHLSRAGVELARRVGAEAGPFDRVVTSRIARTRETVVAMGFAVDEQMEVLGEIPPEVWAAIGHHDRWSWSAPFAVFARLVRDGGATARFARGQAEAWRAVAEAAPEGGSALVISHGRAIECGAVACLPDADHATWGSPFGKLEGLRLVYDKHRWTGPELLRVMQSWMHLPGWRGLGRPDGALGRPASRDSHSSLRGESSRLVTGGDARPLGCVVPGRHPVDPRPLGRGDAR